MDKSSANIGKCVDHLQCDQFEIFTALPRTMDRNNTKLGEGVNRLFKGLLAVFHLGKASMQIKHITILPSSACYLYWNEFSSAFTKHLLICTCDLCVCVTAFLIVFLSWNTEIQCVNTTPNEEGCKERKMNAQSVCVCVPMPEWNYFPYGHIWLHCSDKLSYFWLTEDSK